MRQLLIVTWVLKRCEASCLALLTKESQDIQPLSCSLEPAPQNGVLHSLCYNHPPLQPELGWSPKPQYLRM